MNEAQTESLLQFFKAVGQPERVKILGLLANRPYSDLFWRPEVA